MCDIPVDYLFLQYSRLQLCLKSAGGTVKLCTEEDSHCEAICEKKSIVITPDQVQEWMQKIFDQLDRFEQFLCGYKC